MIESSLDLMPFNQLVSSTLNGAIDPLSLGFDGIESSLMVFAQYPY